MPLDYDAINDAAVRRFPQFLERLLPGGTLRGHEYVCGSLQGGIGESFSVNLNSGKWAEFAGADKGGDCISLWAAVHGLKQGDAARELAQALGLELRASSKKKRRNPADLVPVMPATAAITAAIFEHKDRGKAARHWAYKDADGRLLGYACRFDFTDAEGKRKKDILPLTCWQYPDGKPFWRFKAFEDPRPLYGLDRLAKRPDAPILLVEGEKTADAAQEIFPAHVAVTWPGGSKAVGKTDLSPFSGRKVLLWPDADQPGCVAVLKLHALILEAGAASVELVMPPGDVLEGWDVADAPDTQWPGLRSLLSERRLAPEAFKTEAEARFGNLTIPDEGEEDASIEISPQLAAARRAATTIGRKNILYAQSSFWMWDKRCWRKAEDMEIRQIVQRLEECNPALSSAFVNGVTALLQNELYKPGHQFDQNRRAIVLANGELYWEADKWVLKPHKRESYRTTCLPVSYTPGTLAPRFGRFLDEVFRDDQDRGQKKSLLCEALGYSLLSTCEYEKFFLLIGPGANGKSVLMEVLAALVGLKHVCAVQPSQFDNRFQRAHMQGKLVNLVTEIAEGAEIADAELKGIVSGELTTAEHKLKPPFDFHPFATCWFGTNHMPHTRDFSQALFRRAAIITFNRIFAEHEQDKDLKNKLKGELSGILNMALNAVAEVFRNGRFTQSTSSEEAKQEWRMESDQAAQFIEDCCEWDKFRTIASGELFRKYQEWAGENGIRRTLSRKSLTQRLVRLGAGMERTNTTRLITGLSIKA